ncbi:efflux RND transporter periplasmic adaptor subunit [Oleiagrimonas sp. C23AA]|uniref:efflux RND transporter periplasmic adaptor subunit n=1 Tax=Oleiagrimonas sp. C23AA TaxID=2719047 RepID=UPI0014239C46|nr:efflux RND transporter periplasmic adaptor subunit [Oleiagrimonas sp. C23AA]NII10244.1 efflux RND transporter periplasmic adaptor subunit [Oleiagrimonas sp. C23AA]
MKSLSLRTLVLGSSVALLAACGGKPQQQHQMPPPQVGVITAKPTRVPLTRDLVGRLSAFRSADVRARVAGVLLKRTYDEGTDVKKGQVLFQIDPAPLRATLNSAEAQLAQAQATYANNHTIAERDRRLIDKHYISQSDLDNALAAERSSAAAVKQAKANVQSARINLGYATVRAPISGRADKQQVTEGALVGQGSDTLLTTVDQIDPLYVNFTMGVDELNTLREEQAKGNATLLGDGKGKVQLTLPNGSTYGQTGELDFSGSTVDPNTGAVQLRATVPNPEHTLLPGMFANVRVTLGSISHAFLIPEAAVQQSTNGPYVLTVGTDNKVQQTQVETSDSRNGNWIVTGGLKQGDKVIVSGLAKARPGQPAKVTAYQPKPAGQPSQAPKGAPAAAKSSAPASSKH